VRPRLYWDDSAIDPARAGHIQAILDGRQPTGLALSDLLKPFPLEWERQRAKWLATLEPKYTLCLQEAQ